MVLPAQYQRQEGNRIQEAANSVITAASPNKGYANKKSRYMFLDSSKQIQYHTVTPGNSGPGAASLSALRDRLAELWEKNEKLQNDPAVQQKIKERIRDFASYIDIKIGDYNRDFKTDWPWLSKVLAFFGRSEAITPYKFGLDETTQRV